MPQQEAPLELNLLIETLDASFGDLIEGTGSSVDARRSNFLSKAVAAFVLTHEAGASKGEAVSSCIDGGNDHGIDSVYIGADGTLWLIQSKYIASGRGEPDLGDVSKFRDGVVDLLAGKYDRFNEALNEKRHVIESALSDEGHRVKVVLAHTGGAISDDRRNIFSDLENAYNATHEAIYMVETKARNHLKDVDVVAKAEAAQNWCRHATEYSLEHGVKSWKYVLFAHDKVEESRLLKDFVSESPIGDP